MPFRMTVRPRYGEVDMQGVVFNAHWLTYFDDAATRFFEWLGYDPKRVFEEEFDFMVVKAVVEWKGPAGFHDEVLIEVVPTRTGNSSFDLTHTATVDSRPACTATITYVLVEPGTNRPMRLPDDLRGRFARAAGETQELQPTEAGGP